MPLPCRARAPRGAILAGLALLLAQGAAAATPAGRRADIQLIPASDSRFLYEGRFDFQDTAGPVVVWQASRIGLDFEGGSLALLFGDVTGQSFFDVAVDDVRFVVGVRAGAERRFEAPRALGSGRHRMTINKRSEASAGHVRFEGVEIARGSQASAPAPGAYRLAMEFFGDSITAGACNEDGEADQWKDRRTHNGALSYAALTAAALGADHRSIAVSGMGIREGWADVRAGEVWDRIYPIAESPRTDLRSWQPDIAFVNLGENDASFTERKGRPFPPGFREGYVSLVRTIRAAYPGARLVLLRGGMGNGAKNPALREAWQAAVTQLEAEDAAMSHFVFKHWTRRHPRVADHQELAAELVAWLQAQPFFSAWAAPAPPPAPAASPPEP
jgi:lysophospholipase L1-like esterase